MGFPAQCRDYDVCVSCLPQILDGNIHPQDHIFTIMTSAPLQDRIHSQRHKEHSGHTHRHQQGRFAAHHDGRGQHYHGHGHAREHLMEKHEAFCDLCNKEYVLCLRNRMTPADLPSVYSIRGKRYKCVQCPDVSNTVRKRNVRLPKNLTTVSLRSGIAVRTASIESIKPTLSIRSWLFVKRTISSRKTRTTSSTTRT